MQSGWWDYITTSVSHARSLLPSLGYHTSTSPSLSKSGSSSDSVLDANRTISLSSGGISPEEWSTFKSDVTAFTTEIYLQTLLVNPFAVIQVLAQSDVGVEIPVSPPDSPSPSSPSSPLPPPQQPRPAEGEECSLAQTIQDTEQDTFAQLRALVRYPDLGGGGWGCLNGHPTLFTHTFLFSLLQPLIEDVCYDALDMYSESVGVGVVSHVVAGVVLHPLELARTRMVAQDCPFHKPIVTVGPFHALWQIRQAEKGGSFTRLLLQPHMILLPALVHGIVPVLEAVSSWTVGVYFGLDSVTAPIACAILHGMCLAGHAAILTPLAYIQQRMLSHRAMSLKEGGTSSSQWAWWRREGAGLIAHHSPPARRSHSRSKTRTPPTTSPVPSNAGRPPHASISRDSISLFSPVTAAVGTATSSLIASSPTLASCWYTLRRLYRGFWPNYYSLLIRAAFRLAGTAHDEDW